ncbi:hypothetical protein [Candidatus Sororendozoicomonas aggregata]|uniref:hypothetical protein n=1 Tax=Candidatus Sororendozoicomonas aggregata TaxID=3073239 RepID=UPI002ED67476
MQTLPKASLELASIQQREETALLNLPNVVGVGIGTKQKGEADTGTPCITALVSSKLPKSLLASTDLIPRCVGEKKTPTDVIDVGEIFAGGNYPNDAREKSIHDSPIANDDSSPFSSPLLLPEPGYNLGDQQVTTTLTRRIRPAQGGFSCGHYRGTTTATIGTCCYDSLPSPSMPEKYYILSNNHVLADLNDARVGDSIVQPGPADGGVCPQDTIARLTRFIPIEFSTDSSKPLNYVDAAIAEGNLQDLNREMYWGGHVKDLYTTPSIGDILQKCGRTTGFTTGRVIAINTTLDVGYVGGKVARFTEQIVTTRMSMTGDSGSLVVNTDEHAVGLMCGSSNSVSVINNILYVQQLLQIRVHEK